MLISMFIEIRTFGKLILEKGKISGQKKLLIIISVLIATFMTSVETPLLPQRYLQF